MSAATPWIAARREPDSPRLRLLCLPYAGGGAGVFRGWEQALPEDVDLLRIQLPGRETRFAEPAIATVDELVPALADAVRPWLDRPFAVFGHSMGALIGYELLRHLRCGPGPAAVVLYASGHRAPHLPHPRPPIAHLDDERFVEELRWMKGTPEEVLAHRELLELVLPTLRADIGLWESYRHRDEPPLECPIVVLGGQHDEVAKPAELPPWQQHTEAACEVHLLPADHFYLHGHRDALLALLARDLRARMTE